MNDGRTEVSIFPPGPLHPAAARFSLDKGQQGGDVQKIGTAGLGMMR